jgi:hypothetical protein
MGTPNWRRSTEESRAIVYYLVEQCEPIALTADERLSGHDRAREPDIDGAEVVKGTVLLQHNPCSPLPDEEEADAMGVGGMPRRPR